MLAYKQRITCATGGCTGRALTNSDQCVQCWRRWWKGLFK